MRMKGGVWKDVATAIRHGGAGCSGELARLHRKRPALAAHLAVTFLSGDAATELRQGIEAARAAAYNAIRPKFARSQEDLEEAWEMVEAQRPQEAYAATWEGACSAWVAAWLSNNNGGGEPMGARDTEMVPLYGLSVTKEGPVPADRGEMEMALDDCPMLREAMRRKPKGDRGGSATGETAPSPPARPKMNLAELLDDEDDEDGGSGPPPVPAPKPFKP